MKQAWDKIELLPAIEQRLTDQAIQILVNGCLKGIEIEEITRRCETTNLQEEHVDQVLNVMAEREPEPE